jgi:uncharacterized membrane protein
MRRVKVLTFIISTLITMAIYVLVKMVIFKEDLTRSLIFGFTAGVGAAIGIQLYLRYIKPQVFKTKSIARLPIKLLLQPKTSRLSAGATWHNTNLFDLTDQRVYRFQ